MAQISDAVFKYDGENLNYFIHCYNNMFHYNLSERSIEIPIIASYLKFRPQSVLEIGNVTKHYYDNFKSFVKKDTLDKYESAYDVINMDINAYSCQEKYDFIYSISTFEHMDSDGGRNPDYNSNNESNIFSSVAFENLHHVCCNLLKDDGKFVLTFPLKYLNSEIDRSIMNGELDNLNVKKYSTRIMLKKNGYEWIQTSKSFLEVYDAIKNVKKDGVRAVCILELLK